MTAAERESKRLERVEALKRENHISKKAARKEELTHSPYWKAGKETDSDSTYLDTR